MFKFVAVSLSIIAFLNAMADTSTVMSAGRVPALSDLKIVSEGVLQGRDISGQIITVIAAPLK